MKKIVILGAGPTGLGAALELSRRKYGNWEIFERNRYVGGLSASLRDERGFTWDIGGHIIFSSSDRFNRIVDDLLGNEGLRHVRESWIWLSGSFVRYPFQNNFHLHPNKEIVLDCLMGLVDARGAACAHRNFEEWIRSVFGEGISRHFMIPYNRKVWAFPLDRMDYGWIAERVSVVDLKNVLRNVTLNSSESEWGPNHTFRYPIHGGVGGFFEKFLPFTNGRLHLEKEAVLVRPDTKEIVFGDGDVASYDVLVSTIPLSELLGKLEGAPEGVRELGGRFISNGGFMVGVGLSKPCPSNKNWMYFPDSDSPFYRVTYLSNYSPNMTPKGDYFSLLAETSFSAKMHAPRETIIEETIQGLVNCRLMSEQDRESVVSTWLFGARHSLPVPFLGRDRVLSDAQGWLQERDILSRGRFGGWKYEVSNMDHSVLQGIEAVEHILDGAAERIYRLQG